MEKRKRESGICGIRGWIIVWTLRSGIARPPRLNCDQGLNGDFQGRWRYVTDFYDLFAFAVRPPPRPARIIDFVRRIPPIPVCSVAEERRWTLRSGRAVSFPRRKPSNGSAPPYTVRATKIEAGINFTVRRGKETLRGNGRYIGDREYPRRYSCVTRRRSLTKDL